MPRPTPADAKKFLFATDFPIDKVVYKREFSASVPKANSMADSQLYTFQHGLPFTPHCIGIYSDDDFDTTYDFGNGPEFNDPTFNSWSMQFGAVVESDSTEVRVRAINWDTTRTFKFRIVGLAPNVTPSNSTDFKTTRVDDFLLNTDYNYLKIFDQGSRTISTNGTQTISHGLGYPPSILAFSEYNGIVRRVSSENYVGIAGPTTRVSTTDSTLTLEVLDNFVSIPVTIHYRIYVDE